jgi:cytochrome P450
MLSHYIIGGAIVAVLLAWLSGYGISSSKKGKLPPGPPRIPLLGNLHQAPQDYPWRTYQQWSREYGPVFSLQYGLSTVIMLGNYEAAHDLLDKRSNIYSSRPRVVMGGECVSKGFRSLLMEYGQRWRTQQRLQASCLNIRISQSYLTLQDLESKQLIYELLAPEVDFSDRFHRYSSSVIFALAYGRRMTRGDEPEVQGIDQVMENFLYAARVGTWIVDALPILNYLPSFLASWKGLAEKLHEHESTLYMHNLENGQQCTSWNWSKQLGDMKESQGMSKKELAYTVGILYEAGSDTTTMALEVFVMAMVLYPEVMKKAQAELDAVIGPDTLPDFTHKTQLPYIDAVIKEVLRWRPVSAGGIPHAVIQDDEYMGYHIPKGATVIGNHWSISMDENVYEDPQQFNPDRWIQFRDLPLIAFGFGRRVCTGQHIARNSLFINIARLLWTFNIDYRYTLVDGKKQRCEVDEYAFTQGFNSRPCKFEAEFTVRSKREAVVRDEWTKADKDLDNILEAIKSNSSF